MMRNVLSKASCGRQSEQKLTIRNIFNMETDSKDNPENVRIYLIVGKLICILGEMLLDS